MSIHDLARADFKGKRGELQSIEVTEFADLAEEAGEEVPRVYFYRFLTGAELVRLTPFCDFLADPVSIDQRIIFEAFIVAARDEKGDLLFSSVNRRQVETDWDFDVVDRIVRDMGHLKQLFKSGDDPEIKKD